MNLSGRTRGSIQTSSSTDRRRRGKWQFMTVCLCVCVCVCRQPQKMKMNGHVIERMKEANRQWRHIDRKTERDHFHSRKCAGGLNGEKTEDCDLYRPTRSCFLFSIFGAQRSSSFVIRSESARKSLTSHSTLNRSFQRMDFTGQMIQPTASKHWMKSLSSGSNCGLRFHHNGLQSPRPQVNSSPRLTEP